MGIEPVTRFVVVVVVGWLGLLLDCCDCEDILPLLADCYCY